MRARQKPPEVCRECGAARPSYDTRDVELSRRGLKVSVPAISGWFCDHCREIEFDEATDSLERWAAAGDTLVLRDRERALRLGLRLRRQRQVLGLTQAQACMASIRRRSAKMYSRIARSSTGCGGSSVLFMAGLNIRPPHPSLHSPPTRSHRSSRCVRCGCRQ